jgi:hypothetical protein
MDVTIEAIKFNHDPSSADMDALTIRKNEDDDIVLPEWKSGKLVSPAAYVCAPRTGLTFAIQLKRFHPSVQRVEVSGTSEGILGTEAKATIYFKDCDLSDFTIIHPANVRLGEVGVGQHQVFWDWELQPNVGEKATLQTDHKIYTVFGPPSPPWGRDPLNPAYEYEPPWVDVLEKACEWAAGAQDAITAASKITVELNKLGTLKPPQLQYGRKRPFAHLQLSGTHQFVFSDFLKRLYCGGTTMVNCTDCATLVTSFANIVGCNLFQSRMGGSRFYTNPIRLIGFERERPARFDFHEVAWEYPCEGKDNLYDCCLHVDGDTDPASNTRFRAMLPVNIPLGDHKGEAYHYRLVKKGESCVALPKTKKRPNIARDRFSVRPIHAQLEDELKKRFDFESWEKNFPAPGRLFFKPIETFRGAFSLSEALFSEGWKCDRQRVLIGGRAVSKLSESVWQWTKDTDTTLRALCYLCESVQVARAFLLNLLGEFQFPVMRLLDAGEDPVTFGDLAFSDPEFGVTLFARANIVVFLQNIGSNSISLSRLALKVDAGILNALDSSEGVQSDLNVSETQV